MQTDLRAIAFDLDGLLIDSETLFFEVGNIVLQRRGHEFTDDHMHRMIGRRSTEAFRVLIDDLQLSDSIGQLQKESREVFYELMPTKLNLMPGARALIEVIAQFGLPIGIATSSSREYTERVLDQFDLTESFGPMVTSDDVSKGKPDPEVYMRAARALRVNPSQLLVFEDSPAGMSAAVDAGATCVVVPSRFVPDADWSDADIVIDRLDQPEFLSDLKEVFG